jgi:hypothetical protein
MVVRIVMSAAAAGYEMDLDMLSSISLTFLTSWWYTSHHAEGLVDPKVPAK